MRDRMFDYNVRISGFSSRPEIAEGLRKLATLLEGTPGEEFVDHSEGDLSLTLTLGDGFEYDQDNEHPEYTLEDWAFEASEQNTHLGYAEWVQHRMEEEEKEEEEEV